MQTRGHANAFKSRTKLLLRIAKCTFCDFEISDEELRIRSSQLQVRNVQVRRSILIQIPLGINLKKINNDKFQSEIYTGLAIK